MEGGVPIHELERHLATYIDRAARGEQIVVTRHGKPVVMLVARGLQHCHVGEDFGRPGSFGPLEDVPEGAGKRFLEILAEDRASEDETPGCAHRSS